MNKNTEASLAALNSGGGSAYVEIARVHATLAVAEEIRRLREALTSANTAEKPEEKPVAENTDAWHGSAETPVRLTGPLADYRMSYMYRARHVHSQEGVCVKNVYDEHCTAKPEGKPAIHARAGKNSMCGLSGEDLEIALFWSDVTCVECLTRVTSHYRHDNGVALCHSLITAKTVLTKNWDRVNCTTCHSYRKVAHP